REVALYSTRAGGFVANEFSRLKLIEGYLVATLPAGDYRLILKNSGKSINVLVGDGDLSEGYLFNSARMLELPARQASHLKSLKANDKNLEIDVTGVDPLTRVHVIGTRFLPGNDPFAALGGSQRAGLRTGTARFLPSLYISGRNLGDELRYILERRYAEKFVGNMLSRPEILLNPWAVRDTESGRELLEAGDRFDRKPVAPSAPAAATRSRAKKEGSLVRKIGSPSYEFLGRNPVVIPNLVPDKNGRIRINLDAFGDRQHIHVLLVDPEGSTYRSVSLPDAGTKIRDLRLLTNALDPKRHFTEQEQVTLLKKGDSLKIPDLLNSKFEVYDHLGSVYRFFLTLKNDSTLREFAFVTDWAGLTAEEKRAKYSRYACHELSFFVSRKDPAFFKKVVLPHLANKKDVTFMDDYLLGNPLARYYRSFEYARLNVVERILLAQSDQKRMASLGLDLENRHDLHSIGMRNAYDIALNSAKDLFIYDADMEWDVGSHWYRPTRINFAVSGSDYGWRSGTGKWPNYYEDSLPPVVEIGPGSPTGLVAGTGTKFPAKYQRAIYAFDWTFGTIWAIHLKQEGAGYVGTRENFLSRTALPLTDAAVGQDGNLYFLVGGRGTQSAMYRVRYTGKESTEPAPELAPTEARRLARSLEKYHGVEDPAALQEAWSHLASDDRFLRHAARVAIESQPVGSWASRVEKTGEVQASITAAVALARSGSGKHQTSTFDALNALPFETLSKSQKLGILRGYALTFIRLGKPTSEQRGALLSRLEDALPSGDPDLDTELIRVLTYLQSPKVVSKTIKLIKNRPETIVPDWAAIAARNSRYGGSIKGFLNNPPPTREIYYVLMLSNIRNGWTLEERKACIELLNEAGKGSGGASFPGFLSNIRDLHLTQMNNEHRSALADISGESFNPVPDFEIMPPQGPGQQYTLESAGKHVNSFKGASFTKGRSLYFAVSCGACHRLGGLGGDIGPDLSSIPNKFDATYVLEAIISPNKDVSDQYSMFDIVLADGSKKQGLYVRNGKDVSIYPAGHSGEPFLTTIDQVKSVRQTSSSQMPSGLINSLNPSELRDLMGYLMSGGNPKSGIYR
ncbi:c-type cytochrome, partial [bacterium]|nr:c-type cytochrome [bacterium]